MLYTKSRNCVQHKCVGQELRVNTPCSNREKGLMFEGSLKHEIALHPFPRADEIRRGSPPRVTNSNILQHGLTEKQEVRK